MSAIRLQGHPSLPAPVVHAGFSAHQSKSHVLAGVQDAYWSDDDTDDADCPLCLEEMDISDLNFKPCVCGYQICRFCWHHIKQNLNRRCPACRREYTDEAVQFKPIAKEDHKRLTQQKKQRERERKELDTLGRRHLANVRVVQRNVVYVVGIGPRFAKEELIPTLRSSDYFGQYGKITKILLVKRTPSGGGAPVVGLYITYHRREDAARCISTVDGTPSPGGGREVMRASYGTTKYCMAFLRGLSCTDNTCMNLHEWGDEKDCFTKEDLTTLKHTMKDTENRPRTAKDAGGLPRAAAWGIKAPNTPVATGTTNIQTSFAITPRPNRRGGQRPARNPNLETKPTTRPHHDRKDGSIAGSTKTPSVTSSSRPPTPAIATLPQRPATPPEVKTLRSKEPGAPQPSASPAPSLTMDSDLGSGSQDISPSPARPRSAASVQSSTPSVPPGPPDLPPGLSGPPGLPPPSRNARADLRAPPGIQQVPSTYQMSTAAQALLDDVKSRRQNAPANTNTSIFPDLDRTLRMVSGDDNEFGGFSFNLDPKLAGDNADTDIALPDLEAEANMPFMGGFMDTFPALRPTQMQQQIQNPRAFMAPPGLAYPHNPGRLIYDPLSMRGTPVEHQSTGGSNYLGTFNPFGESSEIPTTQSQGGLTSNSSKSPFLDEERKVSRFGFARGRQGSTAASSPIHAASPLSASDSYQSFFSPETTSTSTQPHWNLPSHVEYGYSTPSLAHAEVQPLPLPSHTRFQPFDNNIVSEAQLREFIQSSRERASSVHNGPAVSDQQQQYQYGAHQPFNDPAIMSARFASPVLTSVVPVNHNQPGTPSTGATHPSPIPLGPPPGLGLSPGHPINHASSMPTGNGTELHVDASRMNPPPLNIPTPTPSALSLVLSPEDFPALGADTITQGDVQPASESPVLPEMSKELANAERQALKKAAAVDRALERQKAAQEKAAARAAEKARLAQEKAAEKERLAAIKEEKEKAEKERLEKERLEKERLAREKAAQAEKDRLAAEAEKERRAAEKAKALQAKAAKPPATPKNARVAAGGQSTPANSDKQPVVAPKATEPVVQAPILSKMPKKNKPTTRPIKIPKDGDVATDEHSAAPSAAPSEAPILSLNRNNETVVSTPAISRAQSVDRMSPIERTSLANFFDEIDIKNPAMDLPNHPFFDLHKINPAAKMPLEYGPLVHALSALSVGGGSFATTMPSGSIDNAVSSFQQLLETLTQTISDLLRLLPRTTWDDSSSFDGVLRDMLKGEDFLDDTGDDASGKEDEVAALTLALERRARWMEVQLSKLEELHRDINTAAVRAVLAFNDSGWDRHSFLPRVGNTLLRFDSIGLVEHDGKTRPMTADELEKKLVVAKEAAVFAETEFREVVVKMQAVRPIEVDELSS